MRADLCGAEDAPGDALDILVFVIHTFRLNEDEVAKLHAPLLAFACIDLVHLEQTRGRMDFVVPINIAQALLKETSASFFATSERDDESDADQHVGLAIASDFYSAVDNKSAKIPSSGFAQRMTRRGLSNLLDIGRTFLAEGTTDSTQSSLNALSFLADQLPRDQPVRLSWKPEVWLGQFLRAITESSRSLPFDVLESAVQALIALESASITPPLLLDKRSILAPLVDLGMLYLRPRHSAYQVQAAALVWALEDLSKHKHVEGAICARLSSGDWQVRQAACEAFGNLWRFTEDSLQPATRLFVPMSMMLESLRSDDLGVRRIGEAWMRCSVKSHLRSVVACCRACPG